ncbi:MAG: DMT family transporter [Ahrensia sp.]|nr:DMT family transporter [Ahrensia sp.]
MTPPNTAAPQPLTQSRAGHASNYGAALVLASAISWSLGGLIVRLADVANPWNTIFWRTGTATILILLFMLWRDGRQGTLTLFKSMGWPGFAVGAGFTISSVLFVIALDNTTVANVTLMQASVPLIAALISWILFREALQLSTWIAIGAVIVGVGVMVSDSFTGAMSPLGDGLAILVAVGFAATTVTARRYAHIRMTPAVCLGAAMACVFALVMSYLTVGSVSVTPGQLFWLIAFGVSFGGGMVLFASGVPLIPSAFAALLGTAETILGPLWVWLVIGEVPSNRTLIGGGIVLAALIAYLGWQLRQNRRERHIVRPN